MIESSQFLGTSFLLFGLVILNYVLDYSLNCTQLSPIIITNL